MHAYLHCYTVLYTAMMYCTLHCYDVLSVLCTTIMYCTLHCYDVLYMMQPDGSELVWPADLPSALEVWARHCRMDVRWQVGDPSANPNG
jgi:hypothetical protein